MEDEEVIEGVIRKLILPRVCLHHCCPRQARYKCNELTENAHHPPSVDADAVSKHPLRNGSPMVTLPQGSDSSSFPSLPFVLSKGEGRNSLLELLPGFSDAVESNSCTGKREREGKKTIIMLMFSIFGRHVQ